MRIMKLIGIISIFLTGALLMVAVIDFPDWGDPQSPASTYLSVYYLTHVLQDSAVPNVVTAVLADYRGFDTMLETAVVFVAGVAIYAILRSTDEPTHHLKNKHRPITGPEEKDMIIRTTTRLLLPAIQIFAFYVIAHGHHSPGGGFQGGVILAAGLILVAITFSLHKAMGMVTEKMGMVFSNTGIFIYGGTGLLCLFLGANFLDYSVLEAVYPATDEVMARSHSMLVVEVGVGFTVMSSLYLIYGNLASKGRFKRGL